MSGLSRVTAREVIVALQRAGFLKVSVSGSKGGHRQFRRPEGGGRVTVPVHGGRPSQPRCWQASCAKPG